MRVDFWAELPSPVKTEFRSAFRDFALKTWEKSGLLLRDYIPATMSAQMPYEDYLLHMEMKNLPECFITGAYGECSAPEFIRKYLDSGIYRAPEVLCYFPEVMVVDMKQLGSRPVPENYADLSASWYEGELCLIGNRGRPDPMLPLYVNHVHGSGGVDKLRKNIATLASPSTTIRVIGRQSNQYGSVFVMPALFAQICLNLSHARIIQPADGFLAEPILIFYRNEINPLKEQAIRSFLGSEACCSIFLDACFPVPGDSSIQEYPINPWCKKKLLYPERFDISCAISES